MLYAWQAIMRHGRRLTERIEAALSVVAQLIAIIFIIFYLLETKEQ